MSKVFQVKPKRIKRSNGTVLTPDMVVIVTLNRHATTLFSTYEEEVKKAYMEKYKFDYNKACCNSNDFDVKALG